MAVMDSKLLFCDDKTLIGSIGTAVIASGVSLDLTGGLAVDAWGTARNEEPGDTPLWLNVVITTAVTSSGAATVAFVLEDSANDTSYSTVFTSLAFPKATLVAGYALRTPVPTGLRRYVKMYRTIATAATTAGACTAYLSGAPHDRVDLKR